MAHVQMLLIEFIEAHYEARRDDDIELPDYDSVLENCRDYCDECDEGWTETYGEYDGPRAEEVPPDEADNAPGPTDEERTARQQRNLERRRERARRRAAQQEAEEEVIDREFNCDGACDSFLEHVCDAYREEFDPNLTALKRRWEEFLAEKGELDFPPLLPVRAQP